MGEGTRPHRVAEEFREILAEEIPRLKDPRIGFVTVTHVDVTNDLRHATVFYTALGDDATAAPDAGRPDLGHRAPAHDPGPPGPDAVHARGRVPGGRGSHPGRTGLRAAEPDRVRVEEGGGRMTGPALGAAGLAFARRSTPRWSARRRCCRRRPRSRSPVTSTRIPTRSARCSGWRAPCARAEPRSSARGPTTRWSGRGGWRWWATWRRWSSPRRSPRRRRSSSPWTRRRWTGWGRSPIGSRAPARWSSSTTTSPTRASGPST